MWGPLIVGIGIGLLIQPLWVFISLRREDRKHQYLDVLSAERRRMMLREP